MTNTLEHSKRASRKQLAANQGEPARGPEALVKVDEVARVLNVTTRYVGILTAEGRIPSHKFGRRCIRYRLSDVLKALGVETEAAATCGAGQ